MTRNWRGKRLLSLIMVFTMMLSALPPDASPVYSEEVDPVEDPYAGKVGCAAIFNEKDWTSFAVAEEVFPYDGSALSDEYIIGAEGIPDDFVAVITEYYVDEANCALWYKIDAAEGKTLPEALGNRLWVFQNWTDDSGFADSLIFIKESASGGFFGERSFTVSGDLPKDASVVVESVEHATEIMSELGVESGFVVDISVVSENAKWQPDGNVTITIKTDKDYPVIRHYLDNVEIIQEKIANDTAVILSAASMSVELKELLRPAIEAYQVATESTEEAVAMEWITDVQRNGDGTISFVTDSLSVFAASTAGYMVEVESFDIVSNSILLDAQTNVYYAGAYWISKGSLTITDGNKQAKTWMLYWNSTETVLGSVTSPYGDSVENSYVNLLPITDYSLSGSYYHATLTIKETVKTGDFIQVNMIAEDGAVYFVHLYVKAETAQITFDANGGTVEGEQKVTKTAGVGMQVVLPTPDARDGYVCGGWRTEDGTDVGACGSVYTVTGNEGTFEAIWREEVTLLFDANGGVFGNDVSYNVATGVGAVIDLIPDDKVTREGYYFCGWYTEPEGGERVGYNKDALSADNIAAGKYGYYWQNKYRVEENVTTLYAHWTTEYMLSKPLIGIGLNVYFHLNSQYVYQSGSMYTQSSYTLPNEPSNINNGYPRATNVNGKWEISSDTLAFLKGTAVDYISEQYKNSPQYFAPDDTADGSEGVAHFNGEEVKAVLSLTDDDYLDIFYAWYDWTLNTDGGYEAFLSLLGEQDNNLTDWAEMTKEDFLQYYKIVPYVVKRNTKLTDGLWYIDMVIMKKGTHALGYERGDLADGYVWDNSVTFPGFTFYEDNLGVWPTERVAPKPESAPVKVDENGNVATDAEGNPITAQFLYWEDQYGNRYDRDIPGKDTVIMDRDYVLYAVWDYPDVDNTGYLQFVKRVVGKDGMFSFTLDLKDSHDNVLSGLYPYEIYDENNNLLTQSGAEIRSGDKFELQNAWYIKVFDLPAGTVCTVTEEVSGEYTADKQSVSSTIVRGNPSYLSIQNTYKPKITYHSNYPDGTSVCEIETKTYGDGYTVKDAAVLNFSANGYSFDGWSTEAGGSGSTYSAGAVYFGNEDLVLYAKWTADLSALTIKVQGCEAQMDPEQSYLFEVVGSDGAKLTVTVLENGWVTIHGVTVGAEYTVTLCDSWSWRYGAEESQTDTISVNADENVFTFYVDRENDQWLDGNDYHPDN